jgi:uncharacterized repeat protein (TIGR01451 family)
MRKTLRWLPLLLVFVTAPLFAQGPTPEGTVITNTATVTWTDANGNSYDPVTADASVTVGFKAVVDVSSPTTVTPASPSTGNELNFTITNNGNGPDSMTVAPTAGSGVTITGYKIGSTSYATLTALNTALAGTSIAAAGNVVVTVVYSVADGNGGESIPVSLTATSRRQNTVDDDATTNVEPPESDDVTVTNISSATVSRLPSNGTQYTATFTVANTGNVERSFTLTGGNSNATTSNVSVTGTGVSGGAVTIASGSSVTITVTYTVDNAALAGATSDVTLTATYSAATATGTVAVTVIRAALTMTKEAYRDDAGAAGTLIGPSDTVVPGETIWYKVSVTNAGGANASNVEVTDPIPAELTYVSTSGDAAGWTINEAAGTVTATLSGALAPAASRFFWIKVTVK